MVTGINSTGEETFVDDLEDKGVQTSTDPVDATSDLAYRSLIGLGITGGDEEVRELSDSDMTQDERLVSFASPIVPARGVDAADDTAEAAFSGLEDLAQPVIGPPGKIERLFRGVGTENAILLIAGLAAFAALAPAVGDVSNV